MEKKRLREPWACGDDVKRPLETFHVDTPIGEMVLILCPEGLHMVYQKDDITDENFTPDRNVTVTLTEELNQMSSHLYDSLTWLKSYFHDTRSFSQCRMPKLCPLSTGSSFRNRVLLTLAKSTPEGKTITYGKLASLAGSPGAQQAVGTVMASNPFQLMVPCHRVVKSDGKVGKYSGGCRNSVKVWLLQHEGCSISKEGFVSQA